VTVKSAPKGDSVSFWVGVKPFRKRLMWARSELPVVRIGRCVRVSRAALAKVDRRANRAETDRFASTHRRIAPLRRSKRGNGEGSIYRRADENWVAAAISMPGRRRKVLYGATRENVRRKLNVALGQSETGRLTDSRGTTLGSFLDIWLAEVAKPSVRHWTFKGYEVHVRLHLKPTLGRMPLDRIEPAHVQRLLNGKLKSGLSPKSVRYLRGTLRTALNHAVR
jgi:hypothetical protein